jgi:hypothetical protein
MARLYTTISTAPWSCSMRSSSVLDRVARVRVAVGANEVEEVGVNEGDDILGEIGSVDDDRGEALRLPKAIHKPAQVDHPLDPRHRPDPD